MCDCVLAEPHSLILLWLSPAQSDTHSDRRVERDGNSAGGSGRTQERERETVQEREFLSPSLSNSLGWPFRALLGCVRSDNRKETTKILSEPCDNKTVKGKNC